MNLDRIEKGPRELALHMDHEAIYISPSIAQKRLSDIIFDADACATNPTFAELRKWLRVGDFVHA